MPPAAAPTTSAQALGNVEAAQSAEQTPEQFQQAADTSLGVQGAQQTVSGLRQAITNTTNLLNGVAPGVEGRTADSLVTSAQANKQIQNESAPINATLKSDTTAATNAQSTLNGLLTQADSQASQDETQQNDTLTNLEDIYKDLYGQESGAATAAEKEAQDEATDQLSQEKINEEANASANSAAAKTPTAAATLSSAATSMASELKSVAGGDGFVSPASYTAGMKAWTAAGLDPKTYDTYMAQYRNPSNDHYLLSTGQYGN